MGNILIIAERRKRISYAEIVQFLELLSALRIEVDADTPSKAFHEVLSLTYSEKLTTYNATSKELLHPRLFLCDRILEQSVPKAHFN